MVHRVESSEFIHEVTERGNLESASNVEIASKVKSNNSSGTQILWIVPEGTVIKPEDCLPPDTVVTYDALMRFEELREAMESADGDTLSPESGAPGDVVDEAPARQPEPSPSDAAAATVERASEPDEAGPSPEAAPDVPGQETPASSPSGSTEPRKLRPEELLDKMILVKLDSSSLENERIQQEIVVENSYASVIQAQNALDTAIIAEQEYLEGTYEQDRKDLEIKIAEAKVELSQAQQYLDFSKRLYRKGYVTKLQLEDDYNRVMKAENQRDLYIKQLEVLDDFTKRKMAKQLQADIKTAEATLKAEKASHELDLEKLRDIQEQITNCTIFATQPGQVVYANIRGRRGGDELVIEEGTVIRENQVIIRLPDPTKMQVKSKINEARIAMVEVGMPAAIRLDAFSEMELEGIVEQVGEYPAPTSWFRSDVKEYEAIIKIFEPPPGLRPGLTAEVKIRVEHRENATQVPVQAILQHGPKYYCVFRDGKGFKAREVTVGPSNEKFVVVEAGLRLGEEVVLNAAAYRDELDLPELPPEALAKGAQRNPAWTGPGQRPPGPAEKPQQGPAAMPSVGQILEQLDKNGNGKLDGVEMEQLPEPTRSRLSAADANDDGVVDRGELTAALSRAGPDSNGDDPESGNRP